MSKKSWNVIKNYHNWTIVLTPFSRVLGTWYYLFERLDL